MAIGLWDTSTELMGVGMVRPEAVLGGGEAVITGLFRTVVRSWDPLHPNLILGSATY